MFTVRIPQFVYKQVELVARFGEIQVFADPGRCVGEAFMDMRLNVLNELLKKAVLGADEPPAEFEMGSYDAHLVFDIPLQAKDSDVVDGFTEALKGFVNDILSNLHKDDDKFTIAHIVLEEMIRCQFSDREGYTDNYSDASADFRGRKEGSRKAVTLGKNTLVEL